MGTFVGLEPKGGPGAEKAPEAVEDAAGRAAEEPEAEKAPAKKAAPKRTAKKE